MTARLANQRKRPAAILPVFVLAWAGLVWAPCAGAFSEVSADHHKGDVAGVHHAGVHHDCPNAQSVSTADTSLEVDCCCDLAAVLPPDAPQLQKVIAWIEQPVDIATVEWSLLSSDAVYRHALPLHETSPPVYLATQRLRI